MPLRRSPSAAQQNYLQNTLNSPENRPKNLIPNRTYFRYTLSQAESPRSRQFMAYTDLYGTPSLPLCNVGSCRFFRLGRLLASSAVILASALCVAIPARAQNEQQQDSQQSVADAARKEKAGKAEADKKSKHVYTEEDLKRAKILTPDDQAKIEARKDQPTAPATAPKPEQSAPGSIDAQSNDPNAPQIPLGDVARKFREMKQARQLQKSPEFHLPIAEPSFAAPKPMLPMLEPLPSDAPKIPHPRFDPSRPIVRRSPFAHPRFFASESPRVAPPVPPLPVNPPARPSMPVAPPRPVKPVVPRVAKIQPPNIAGLVIVQPGDSLWKLAKNNLGTGARWHELAAVNPSLVDPNRINPGTQINLPASASAPLSTSIKVQKGDSLWKIAQSRLGHGSAWTCIAQANPAIRDANRIYIDQELVLPASCSQHP
jgi:nucleoid-associated protein YgaU